MLSKLKKIPEYLQGKYVAEDDFWKITNYLVELQRRQDAYTKAGIKKSVDELISSVKSLCLKYDGFNFLTDGIPRAKSRDDIVLKIINNVIAFWDAESPKAKVFMNEFISDNLLTPDCLERIVQS